MPRISQEGIELSDNLKYQRYAIFTYDADGLIDLSNEPDSKAWTFVTEEGWANCGKTVALYHEGFFYQREQLEGRKVDETALWQSFERQLRRDSQERQRRQEKLESLRSLSFCQ